jgi:hypothetical protein
MSGRRLIVALLTAVLALSGLPGCSGTSHPQSDDASKGAGTGTQDGGSSNEKATYSSLSDPELLQRVEDDTYAEFEEQLASDDYQVQDVTATYVSKEYLDELAYNSQENIYFGYTLSDLQGRFGDQKYVFTLGDDGHTAVKAIGNYDDSFNRIVRNVAIGAGVILVCVTVTVVTDGTAAPAAIRAVHTIFVGSAERAAVFGGCGALAGAIEGVVDGIKTGDMETGLKNAAVSASEGFKWGAMVGAVTKTGSNVLSLVVSSGVVPTPGESEEAVEMLYNGRTQVSFLGGKEYLGHPTGSTRPDVVAEIDGIPTAIEVKNYDLEKNLSGLKTELKRQLTQRKTDLPEGYAQMVVEDVRGRGYSQEFLDQTLEDLQSMAREIDPSIVVKYLT